MERVPQLVESVSLPEKRPIEDMPTLSAQIRRVEAELGNDGRVLVRWSGTEAKLRFMVEGPNPDLLASVVQDMAEAARADLGVPA